MSDRFNIENAKPNTQVPEKYWTDSIYYGESNVFNIAFDMKDSLSHVAKQYPSSNQSIMTEFAFYGVYNIKISQERFLGFNPEEDVFYIGFDSQANIDKEKEAFFEDVKDVIGEDELEDFYEDVREVNASTLLTAIYEKGKWTIVEEEHVLESDFYEHFFSVVKPQCVVIRTDY